MAPTNQAERIAAWRQDAKDFTSQLRTGTAPFMRRLREIIEEKGLAPDRCACVSAFDDFPFEQYCGWLVLEGGHAVSFALEFSQGAESSARLVMWEPATDTQGYTAGLLAAGRELLESERRAWRKTSG